MRQCPAVAWEGWITKTHRRNEPNSGRQFFFGGPAATCRGMGGQTCAVVLDQRGSHFAGPDARD